MYRIWHSEWKIRLPPWARLVPGPYMQKKLGNPGTVMPEVGGRPLAPQLAEVDAVPPDDGHGCQHLRGLEAGGVHQHVGRVARAVDGDDGVGLDVVDGGADQLDVVPGQRTRARRRCPAGCACRWPGSRAPPWRSSSGSSPTWPTIQSVNIWRVSSFISLTARCWSG